MCRYVVWTDGAKKTRCRPIKVSANPPLAPKSNKAPGGPLQPASHDHAHRWTRLHGSLARQSQGQTSGSASSQESSLTGTRSASAKPRSSGGEKKRAPELKEAGAQKLVFTGNLLWKEADIVQKTSFQSQTRRNGGASWRLSVTQIRHHFGTILHSRSGFHSLKHTWTHGIIWFYLEISAKEHHGSKYNNSRCWNTSQVCRLILPTDSFHTSLCETLTRPSARRLPGEKIAKEIVGTPTLEVYVLLMVTSGGRRNVGTTTSNSHRLWWEATLPPNNKTHLLCFSAGRQRNMKEHFWCERIEKDKLLVAAASLRVKA